MTAPLYPSESEIAILVLGKRAKEWRVVAPYLENQCGMPRVDTHMGGRYWPAVEEFFRLRHGFKSVPRLDEAPPLAPKSRTIRGLPLRSDGKDSLDGPKTPSLADRRHPG